MTEGYDPFARYVYEPEGSLWMSEPAFVSGISPEEWEQAAKALRALGEFATKGVIVGGEALDVALTDVAERVRRQARRGREEGWEEPKGGEPSPGQQERLVRLIHRSDYLSNAAEIIREAAKAEQDNVYAERYMVGELAPFLEDECKAANDELRRYKREIGLLGE